MYPGENLGGREVNKHLTWSLGESKEPSTWWLPALGSLNQVSH